MRGFMLLQPGQLEFREVPRPVAGPGEVVLRVRTALTCGTDIKFFLRGHPKFKLPTLFGHEFSGEIAAVGSGVNGFREGDAVMVAPTAPCGHCFFCQRQQENLCDTIMETMVHGAYADFVRLPERIVRQNMFHKPAGLGFDVAALLEPLSCVMHGLEFVPLRPDDSVLLIGAGAISLLHLLALKALGVEHVAVLGRSAERAQHARELGAAAVFSGGHAAATEDVRAFTNGRGADVVIECTGQVDVWEAAPGFARRGGTVVLFGGCIPGTHVRLDTQRFHYDQLRIVSPFHFTPRAVRRSFELITGDHFKGAALISGHYPLDQLTAALDKHRSGAGIKFAVEP